MEHWIGELKVSKKAHYFSYLFHILLIILIFIVPWTQDNNLASVVFTIFLVINGIRAHRLIIGYQGNLSLSKEGVVQFNGKWYQLKSSPVIFEHAIVLKMVSDKTQRLLRLWIIDDSISNREWCYLRFLLFQYMCKNQLNNNE